MAARVSKEKREQFSAFMEEMENGTWLGLSEDSIADLAIAVDKLCTQKIKVKNDKTKAEAKQSATPKEQLPEAPKKRATKSTKEEEAATEETREVKLVEGRKYEAEGNSKLGDAILEYTGETSGEDKAKFKVLFKGTGSVPEGKKVVLPIQAVSATRRRVPKAA